ncbi:hypothetical protein LSCM1_07848 [Leishmania martiniquensis]|uniref:Uncharacterized protein n=1 Tax=Leishmania martiniquensis TaxID=1580590 RepID=A0A836L0F6_9TRYP|nr:hypothetical protein LSCM1_07848 [Leishmania martiniquensis]
MASMLAALSWLLDLDQSQGEPSSSTGSDSDSSDSVAGSEKTEPANPTTFASAGEHLVAELQLASLSEAAALPSGASEAASSPRGAVYSSPRYLKGSFADLDARRAVLFAPSPCRGPPWDGDLAPGPRAEREETPARPATRPPPPKIIPLWGLRSYTSDAVSLSPILSPAPAPASATVATSPSGSQEDEQPLWVSEGAMLSACLSSLSYSARCAAGESAGAARHRSATRATGARAAMPTKLSRILHWDQEVYSRRLASPPPGVGSHQDERAPHDSTEAQKRGAQVSEAGPEEARFVQRAMRAAWMAARPSHTPLLEACASAAARLDTSNPFLDTAAGGRDEVVPGHSIEYMQPPPRARGAVHLAATWEHGATVTLSGAHDSMEGTLLRRTPELLCECAPATALSKCDARGDDDDRPDTPTLTAASAGAARAEGMRGTPAQEDVRVVHVADGLVSVMLTDAGDPHRQA